MPNMCSSPLARLLSGIILFIFPIPAVAQVESEVQVYTESQVHPINRGIFGQFIEHYGRVVEHGVWAELLENRKFFPFDAVGQMNVAAPWTGELPANQVSYAIDRTISLNGVSSQRIILSGSSNSWRGVRQGGFDVVGGKQYTGYLWVRAEPASQAVAAALETTDGATLARFETPLIEAGWQQIHFDLKPTGGIQPAVFRILFRQPGIVWIGSASLMPADHLEGVRKEVVELAKSMAPPLLRWPGGGYVDTYDWRKAIGPRDRRPPQPLGIYANQDAYDSRIDPSDFGTDEFIHFCRLIGAQPYIAVNFGSGTPEMARQWVEYCNGPASSEWGARRVANGHPEPYDVKIWGVGNESWLSIEPGHSTPEGYALYFNEFAKAMRNADPGIQIVAVGDTLDSSGNWNEVVAHDSSAHADFLSIHYYYALGFLSPFYVSHPLEFYRSVVAAPLYVEQTLRETLAKIDAATPGGKRIQIAFDEWNEANFGPEPPVLPKDSSFMRLVEMITKYGGDFNQPEQDALFAARMFHVLMRLGDRVPLACRTHMVNSLGVIRTNSTEAYVTASGTALQIYGPHTGTRLVKVEQRSPVFDVPEKNWKAVPYLDAVATLSEDGKKLFIHLLNLKEEGTMEVQIRINGRSIGPSADSWQIASESILTLNHSGISSVKVQSRQLTGLSNQFFQLLPPHSATTLELTLK
ncbi:MAG: alpha-L-arabinofuranosidase C-terminal domain-containing protein [Terriglobia bacterium]